MKNIHTKNPPSSIVRYSFIQLIKLNEFEPSFSQLSPMLLATV